MMQFHQWQERERRLLFEQDGPSNQPGNVEQRETKKEITSVDAFREGLQASKDGQELGDAVNKESANRIKSADKDTKKFNEGVNAADKTAEQLQKERVAKNKAIDDEMNALKDGTGIGMLTPNAHTEVNSVPVQQPASDRNQQNATEQPPPPADQKAKQEVPKTEEQKKESKE